MAFGDSSKLGGFLAERVRGSGNSAACLFYPIRPFRTYWKHLHKSAGPNFPLDSTFRILRIDGAS